jgi:hypothetical protein
MSSNTGFFDMSAEIETAIRLAQGLGGMTGRAAPLVAPPGLFISKMPESPENTRIHYNSLQLRKIHYPIIPS